MNGSSRSKTVRNKFSFFNRELQVKRDSKQVMKQILGLTLSAQMLLSAPLAVANTAGSAGLSRSTNQIRSLSGGQQTAMIDPNDQIFTDFANLKPESLPLPVSPTESSLDQDPFFLREQAWENLDANTAAQIKTVSFENGRVFIPGARRALKFSAPITPVHATDDFIFFTLNKNSDLFKRAAGNEPTGEGLFFIPRSELLSRSIDDQPMPVFFFPLGGQGWTGVIESVELSETETLAVQNEQGEAVAIELRDVETAMKAQQINLLMATSFTAQNSPPTSDMARLYPAPGTTAAFGLFFTGLDLNHPGQALFADNSPTTGAASAMKSIAKTGAGLWKAPAAMIALALGSTLGSTPAHAWTPPPDLVHRLIYVGSILTGMLAVSVVLKYTHPGIRMKLEKLREADAPKTLAGKSKREIREIFSVFAHVTTVVAQVAPVGFASAVEIFLDRFAPSVAAADHTLVRRFLKKSFFFARDTMKNSPVNAKTFVLGALVMGTVDTGFVVIQYQYAIPAVSHLISPMLGPDGQAKVAEAFDANNPDYSNLMINDSIRTYLYYLLNGASSFSIDSRAQIIDGIIKDTEGEMRVAGIDPTLPENLASKLRRVETKIDVILKSRGLPGTDDFLFDATTIIKKGAAALGYRGTAETAAKESFILATRFGLTANALKKAIAQAEKYASTSPSKEASDTVKLLKETLSNMSFLQAAPKGAEGFKRARQTRQELTILSYEGPVDWMVRYVPETWSQAYSPMAAQGASLLFRQALYSFLSSEGSKILEAPDKDVREFSEMALKNVAAEFQKEHPELQKLSGSELNHAIDSNYKFEKALRLQIEITRLGRERAKAIVDSNYKPEKSDWLGRRQEKRARRAANEQLAIAILADPKINTPEQTQNLWKGFYRDALAKQVGLHLESREAALARGDKAYVDLLDQTETSASESTQNQIKNDKGLSDYLNALSGPEKLNLQSSIYANNYLQAYKGLAIDGEAVPGLSPHQPGRFQKIRQTRFVRESRVLTRALRLAESFVDDSALKTGWHSALSRNVPLFSDLWSSHIRLAKSMLPAMTTGYLWSYYAWQVHMSYGTWALVMGLSAVGVSTPSQWLNRAFRMNEIKAMDSVKSKILYAIPYSWVTFLGMIPVTIFASDANRIYADHVREPILSLFGQIPAEAWMGAAGASGLIATAAHPKVRSTLADLGRRLTGRARTSNASTSSLPGSATSTIRSCTDIFAVSGSH